MASTRGLVAAGHLAFVRPWRAPTRIVAAMPVSASVRSFATRGPTTKATTTATATATQTRTKTATEEEATERQQHEQATFVAVPDRVETPLSPSVASAAVPAALAHDQTHTHTAPSPGGRGEVFSPRTEFEAGTGMLRAYFPGHHRAALTRMRQDLAHIGLIIECRDLRVPLTSWNPVLESALMLPTGLGMGGGRSGGAAGTDGSPIPGLAGSFPGAAAAPATSGERAHILVYTKRDLVVDGTSGGGGGSDGSNDAPLSPTADDLQRLADFHRRRGGVDAVVFLGADEKSSSSASSVAYTERGRRETKKLLASVRAAARRHGQYALTDLRALVVGLPNAGKSTLLNRLRARGMTDPQRRGRAARTGADPGVTRKMGTPVRVLEEAGTQNGVLLYDTPGVFLPYVADPESMLKLALVGSVRQGLVPAVQLADYLLFQLNRHAAAQAAGAAVLAASADDGRPAVLTAPAAATLSPPPHPPQPSEQSQQPHSIEQPVFEGAAELVVSTLAQLKLAAANSRQLQHHQHHQQYWPPYVARYGLPRPTEDVHVLLDAVARRSGKLLRGGVPDHTAAATQFVHAWRRGRLGRFCLDDLSADALTAAAERQQTHRAMAPQLLSLNQARNREKARRKAVQVAKRGHSA